MAAYGQETWIEVWAKRIFLVCLVILGVRWFVGIIAPGGKDVTYAIDMERQELESSLGITLTDDPETARKVSQYATGKVTVAGGEGLGIVYIDGQRAGLHIDSGKYSIFGLHIGDAQGVVNDNITYPYERHFYGLDSMSQGGSLADYYYNKEKGDCLIVFYNDNSGLAVAFTYFNDLDRIAEKVGFN